MSLALFDLDKTLIDGDSEELWVEYLIEGGELSSDVLSEVQQFGEDYVAGCMDFVAWQRFMLQPQATLGGERLVRLRDDYTARKLLPIIRPWMRERLDWHRQQSHQLVVITATNRWLVEPVVAALKVADLIATEPQNLDGVFTGEVEGEPCFQAGKITHLERWLAEQNDSGAGPNWSYSDSYNDLPLLEFADYPVAVTPDAKLAALATASGWEILSG